MTRNILIHHNTFADLSVNDEITENGIYVYLCLKPLVNPNWTYLHTTVTELNSVLSDTDISKRPKQQNIIKQGLKELETANYIKVLSSKKNNFEFELDLDGMVEEYSKDNHYTVFEIEQLKQVLKDNKGYKSIFKYLSDYFYFLTHNDNGIDGQEKEMYYFQEERTAFADECELDVRSFDKYNDILMKNEIIYIHKHDYKYTDSNKQVPNAYGLYKNKDEIDKRCNEYISGLKDGVYLSSIPRGKGSKKQKEEKKAQYTPVEADEFVVTDEELAEHDKRHKELYAKKMEKAVMTESVSMQEVDKTVKADDNEPIDYDTVIAERKAENRVILYDDSNKEVETDDDDSEESSLDKYTKPKETTVNIEYCLNISSKKEAIRVYAAQLEHDDPFDDDNVQPKLVAEFADKWDEHNKEEINPFA